MNKGSGIVVKGVTYIVEKCEPAFNNPDNTIIICKRPRGKNSYFCVQYKSGRISEVVSFRPGQLKW